MGSGIRCPQEVHPHMAPDLSAATPSSSPDLAQTLADMQRAIDQMQQQQALLAQALLNAARGRWDAAEYGVQSVESMLVAFDPALHGKVAALRRPTRPPLSAVS
jgi:ABC-type transporter Mla subunit MlaD